MTTAVASSSSANRRIRVSDEAYLMIGMHACRFPESPIIGFLLGSQANDQFDVAGILPVCHEVPAGPILEICGELAEKSLGTATNKVIGFYFGLEYPSTGSVPPPYIERVTASMKAILGHQCIVLQVKTQFLADAKRIFVEGSLVNGTPVKTETISAAPAIFEKFSQAYSSNLHLGLSDFEDHMNSSFSADYFNRSLIDSLRSL